MIEMKGLTKVYTNGKNKNEVLKSIDLTIEEGEFVAIMGTSGSGKSTLLSIIGGMDNVTEGTYMFEDKPVHTYSQKKLDQFRKDNIGFVFQNFALMNYVNVYDNIAMPLWNRKTPKHKIKELVNEKAKLLGIEHVLKQMPKQLSGGEQQRCAIARVLAMDSKLILADEPTGALDQKNTENIMDILKKVHESGKTIVMVTHDEQVASICSRIIRIQDGKVLE